jgi:hypothetical protein
MINLLTSLSIDEFLQRIGSQPNGNTWSALITSNLDNQQLVDDLQETLTIFAECKVGCFSANNEANTLVKQIINATEDYLILGNFRNISSLLFFHPENPQILKILIQTN